MKYVVELTRCFNQNESATVTVEAASKTDARKKAREMATTDAVEWSAVDSHYDSYSVEDITETDDSTLP